MAIVNYEDRSGYTVSAEIVVDKIGIIRLYRKNPFSGLYHCMDLRITFDQLDEYYIKGGIVQNVFHKLPADEREFIMTGLLPEDWPKGK